MCFRSYIWLFHFLQCLTCWCLKLVNLTNDGPLIRYMCYSGRCYNEVGEGCWSRLDLKRGFNWIDDSCGVRVCSFGWLLQPSHDVEGGVGGGWPFGFGDHNCWMVEESLCWVVGGGWPFGLGDQNCSMVDESLCWRCQLVVKMAGDEERLILGFICNGCFFHSRCARFIQSKIKMGSKKVRKAEISLLAG